MPNEKYKVELNASFFQADYVENFGVNRPTQDLIDNGRYNEPSKSWDLSTPRSQIAYVDFVADLPLPGHPDRLAAPGAINGGTGNANIAEGGVFRQNESRLRPASLLTGGRVDLLYTHFANPATLLTMDGFHQPRGFSGAGGAITPINAKGFEFAAKNVTATVAFTNLTGQDNWPSPNPVYGDGSILRDLPLQVEGTIKIRF